MYYRRIIFGQHDLYNSTTTIDKLFLGFNSGAVAYIVVDQGRGPELCRKIDEVCDRGSTILNGRGGHEGSPKDVIMVVGSYKDIYDVQNYLRTFEPEAFTIVLDSKEVQGEGFKIARVADGE